MENQLQGKNARVIIKATYIHPKIFYTVVDRLTIAGYTHVAIGLSNTENHALAIAISTA